MHLVDATGSLSAARTAAAAATEFECIWLMQHRNDGLDQHEIPVATEFECIWLMQHRNDGLDQHEIPVATEFECIWLMQHGKQRKKLPHTELQRSLSASS